MRKATEQKKTKKERTAMKGIKILTVMLAVMLAGGVHLRRVQSRMGGVYGGG